MEKAHINLSFNEKGLINTNIKGDGNDILLHLVNAYHFNAMFYATVKESIYLFENKDECLSTEELWVT